LVKIKQLLIAVMVSLGLPLALWWALGLGQSAQAASQQLESRPDDLIIYPSTAPAASPNPAIIQLQATLSLTPGKDNTLIEDVEGDVSNGAGPGFFVGRVSAAGSGTIRRGVVAFNIANSGIPTNATILSATLRLNMSQTTSGPQSIELRRLLADWGEGTSNSSGGSGASATSGDATWLHRFFTNTLWLTPGGDFSVAVSASTLVDGPGVYTWSSPAMVADVQAWLNAPATNFGWLLRGNESIGGTVKRFDSRENTTAANRPVLTVQFAVLTPTVYLPLVLR
jgi:hypothetical protein